MEKLALFLDRGEKVHAIDDFQDILRRVTMMKDKDIAYVLVTLENQTTVDRFMTLRTMCYDFLNYLEQCSRFPVIGEDGRKYLLPVVTFVLYWGETPWNEPCHLHDVLLFKDEQIRRLTPDYRFNLVDLSRKDEDFCENFRTDFRYVLYCLSKRKDKTLFPELFKPNSTFRNLAPQSRLLLKSVLGLKDEVINKTVGGITVCKAWEELMEDLKKEGEVRGLEKGREEGREEGRKSILEKMLAAGLIRPEQVQSILGRAWEA